MPKGDEGKKADPERELVIEDEDEDSEEVDGEEEEGEEEEEEEEEGGDETDEELHPVRTAPFEEADEELLAVPCALDAPGLRQGLASNGAVLLEALLPGRVSLEASRACLQLRDEEHMSYMFSNPASQMAPPCGAESIFLDDKVQAQAGAAVLQALRKVRAAVAALGEGELVCAGLPMVSCGAAAMVERPHLGVDGAPAGTSPGTGKLALTAILFLDDVDDAPGNFAGVDAAAWVQRPEGAAAARKGAKRTRHGKTPGAAWLSVTPAAGQCLLLAPGAVRRLRGGRVCITTWWWRRPPACGTPLPPPLVFNAVLAQAARVQLAQLGPARWAVYDRRGAARNAQERAIEGLLVQLGDTSSLVEYWGRAQWDAVPAHFDCDEGQLDGGVRCPTSAHVLYLEVAPSLAAPTVLWGQANPGQGGAKAGGAEAARLYVVPAKEGRLLRFDGGWVHGVPRPACEWLGENDEDVEGEGGGEAEAAGRAMSGGEGEGEGEGGGKGEGDESDNECDGCEEGCQECDEGSEGGGEEEAPEVLRHVLLFNTWDERPPTFAEGGDAEEAEKLQRDTVKISCRKRTSWQPCSVSEPPTSAASSALVARLMGDPRRRARACRFRVDDVAAEHAALRGALRSTDSPACFELR